MKEVEASKGEARLWDRMQEADRERYVVTCQIDSTVRSNTDLINKFGLCDFHSYTMMNCMAF